MIELPRSTSYYRPAVVSKTLDDAKLAELIGDIQEEFPGYGYSRVTHELRRRRRRRGRLDFSSTGRGNPERNDVTAEHQR